MSGFDRRERGPNKMGPADKETDAVYDQMKRGYDEQREQFIQDEISEKKGQIKEKMINKESEQSIKQFITWEFNCINTYKKNKKIRRSGMSGKIIGTEDVHYNNPPSVRQVEEIYKEIKNSLPKPLSQDEQFYLDLQKRLKEQRDAQEANMGYDSCDSEIYGDPYENWEQEEAERKTLEIKWEAEFAEKCKLENDKKKCNERKVEIKQLHDDDIGLKGSCDTTRKADIRNRMRVRMEQKKVTDVPKNNMNKEQAQKVIPTLDLGDDIQEIITDKDGAIYNVIKKGDSTELHHDWRLIWKNKEFSRVKYYNPIFKLEIFEKPIKGVHKYSNEHIRENLKHAYYTPENNGKIIIWDPEMEEGMVNIYEKLGDNTVLAADEENATRDIRMGWDDTKGNDRPYYVYKQSYKDIVTYEPPMHLLSSFSYNISRIPGSYTNEKEQEGGPKKEQEGGPKKANGGKRKTKKKKQQKQKRAGSTKKTKKAKKGGKTSQKKGKQQKQKRGTRGKK
jgi:hypothetical protein